MAAKKVQPVTEGYVGKCPSAYGSHSSMISEWTKEVSDPNIVILEDDISCYATEKNRLDGIADPNRYLSIKQRAKKMAQVMPKVIVQVKEGQIILQKM